MAEKQKYYGFNTGMPTGPDVSAIQKQWPDLKVGQVIPYEEVQAIIDCEPQSTRWKSITDAWRRRELENGHVIDCNNGVAFYVANEEQIVEDKTYKTLRHIGSTARKTRRCLSTVKPQDEYSKNRLGHRMQLMWITEKDATKHRKELASPAPTKALPFGNKKMAGED